VWLGHWSGGLAACSGEMVAARWIEVVAVEASASETESEALALASTTGSSGVACRTG
jgi:hypothetical protein